METDAQTDVAEAEKQANLEKVSDCTKDAQRPSGRAEESVKGRAGNIRKARGAAKPLASNKLFNWASRDCQAGTERRGSLERRGRGERAPVGSAVSRPADCTARPSPVLPPLQP